MHYTVKYLMILFLFMTASSAYSQVWEVPTDESSKENPQAYTLQNVERGKELYQINCKSCHGDPGKNNAMPLVPPPPDIASGKMQANREGEIFYKISTGRGTMPPFEAALSVADRWNLVNFIMNYNPGRTALLIELPPVKAILTARLLDDSRTVEVFAEYEKKEGSYSVLSKKPVYFFVQRTFGKLPVGEAISDENGKAVFALPDNIIGDDNGLVDVFAGLSDEYIVEMAELKGIQTGIRKGHTPLIRRGVLWSTNDNMPYWLIISYFGVVAGVWITIIYVIMQIVKIAKSGKKE